ncbi:MAG: TonB-dependent receptor [Bdellovibrionales bacterium]|nr:TonB-dependent receptor [Bdellovibrionales bacterium]
MKRFFGLLMFLSASATTWAQTGATQPADAMASGQSQSAPAAETGDQTIPAPAPTRRVEERITVTGSQIRRIDVEGPSPVQTLTKKDLEKSGYNSVSDVLRDQTVSSFGGVREQSGSNAAGVASVNLRGLGSTKTLVLLNGHRLPAEAVTGAVDLNLIPMAAVERIEILKDGASAIYGSDAIGGVVNIITRKDFEGVEVRVQSSIPELKGGTRHEIGLTHGIVGEKLSMVNVLQYRTNSVVYSRDREWTQAGMSPTGSPGSYRNVGQNWKADPNCPADRKIVSPNGDVVCGFKFSDYSTELPALQQLSLLSETKYDLNSDVKLNARIVGSQKRVQWSYAPAPGTFTIPGAVAGTLGPGGTPLPGTTAGQDLQARYRLLDLGTRDTEIQTNSFNITLGSEIQLGGSWQLDVSASHNMIYNQDIGVNGYALTDNLVGLIQSGAFNPFAPAGSRGDISSARYQPRTDMLAQLSSVEVKASGDVGQMEHGPVSLAVGGIAFYQRFENKADEQSVAGKVFGSAGSTGGGNRNVQSLFSEVSVPVVKDLELQVAGRFDNYSDFGQTTNPKVALMYHATPSLSLRTSVGTGFMAPLMQDLYAATALGYPSFIDRVACKAETDAGGATPSCQAQQYEVKSGGNTGLKEERSLSYSAGAMFEPNREFNIGADFFMTSLNNVVGLNYEDITIAELNGVNLGQYGVSVTRTNGYIDTMVAPTQNLTSQKVSGVDLQSSYLLGPVRLGLEHSHLLYFKEEGFPGAGMRDKLGENGRPAWRNVLSAAYKMSDEHDFSLRALTTAGHQRVVRDGSMLPAFTSLDFSYGYTTKTWGTFSLGVRNLLNTVPPLDTSNPNTKFNVDLYDQNLRQFIASYKMRF